MVDGGEENHEVKVPRAIFIFSVRDCARCRPFLGRGCLFWVLSIESVKSVPKSCERIHFSKVTERREWDSDQ